MLRSNTPHTQHHHRERCTYLNLGCGNPHGSRPEPSEHDLDLDTSPLQSTCSEQLLVPDSPPPLPPPPPLHACHEAPAEANACSRWGGSLPTPCRNASRRAPSCSEMARTPPTLGRQATSDFSEPDLLDAIARKPSCRTIGGEMQAQHDVVTPAALEHRPFWGLHDTDQMPWMPPPCSWGSPMPLQDSVGSALVAPPSMTQKGARTVPVPHTAARATGAPCMWGGPLCAQGAPPAPQAFPAPMRMPQELPQVPPASPRALAASPLRAACWPQTAMLPPTGSALWSAVPLQQLPPQPFLCPFTRPGSAGIAMPSSTAPGRSVLTHPGDGPSMAATARARVATRMQALTAPPPEQPPASPPLRKRSPSPVRPVCSPCAGAVRPGDPRPLALTGRLAPWPGPPVPQQSEPPAPAQPVGQLWRWEP